MEEQKGKIITSTVQVFKFLSGEEVIATVQSDHSLIELRYLSRPRLIVVQDGKFGFDGNTFRLLPWLIGAGDNKFEINTDTIITRITEKFIDYQILEMYRKQINDEEIE